MRISKNESINKVKREEKRKEMMELLTEEERRQVDRALAIPTPVRRAISDRIKTLTTEIMEKEKERDCLRDYLNGVICSEAG